MKTPLIYGLYMALAGLLLNLALYFAGFHSSAEKLMAIQWPSFGIVIVLAVLFVVLGTKARRAEIPLTENFGYGRALGVGVLIGLFSCIFGFVTNYLYTHVINRSFKELMIQAQVSRWEAAGLSSDRIEKGEAMMRSPMAAVINGIVLVIIVMFIFTLISLVTAAILKRPAVSTQPPAVV